ncbi:pyrroline-5-carboxylate reductase [Neisseriaceae bacterium B1]
MTTLYFLGGGNMANAIIAGLTQAQTPHKIHVANRGAEKRDKLAQQYGIQTSENLPEIQDNDVLILAVKPQDMQSALANVRAPNALVLSLAAGLPVATLSQYLGGNQRIIRIMPNTPARVGLGVSGLYAAPQTSQADRQLAQELMQTCGQTIWLENEDQMHAITAISGSGSAYIFYLLNALQQAAEQQGFDPQTAHNLSLHTFKGAIALAEQTGSDFAQLQNQVTSKGGTTFAALESFRQNQIARHLAQGVAAAANRSREMAK